MHELILVRHGQSELNARGALVGRSDPELTELGREQARAVGSRLAAEGAAWEPGGRLLTSPLGRARATAEVIAQSLASAGVPIGEVEVDDRLIELDYGEYDGLLPSEVTPEAWSAWRADVTFRPPAGETLAELQQRCTGLFDELQAAALTDGDRVVVAVSHVSPIKAAVAWALGTGPEISWRLQLPVAAITRLVLGRRGPAVVSFGEPARLADSSA